MADPVVIVKKIVRIAIIIEDTVETVRENMEECHGIQKLVCRVRDLLSLLQESEMMKHQVVSGPLEDLWDAVSDALYAVTACKGRNTLCPCFNFKAMKSSKKLSRVKNDISQGMMRAIFATHDAAVFVATKGHQVGLNFDVFFLPTHQQTSPLSEHLQSSPRAVTDDFLLSVLTDEPYRSPDAVVSNGHLPRLPTQIQEPPVLAPIITDDVPNNLEPPSDVYFDPHINVDPFEFKHQSHRRPKQPLPPPTPPHMTTSLPPPPAPPKLPPSSLSLPPYVTSPVPKHWAHHPPRQSPCQSTEEEVPLPVTSSMSTASPDARISGQRKNYSGQADGPSTSLPGLRKFSLSELRDATHNFSEKNKIGTNDFGIFYKGVLHDGLKVAIKLQSKDVEASGNNLYIIRVLGYYEHEFISVSREIRIIFLVEEYLPNGNMYSLIYGSQLHWTSRFRIILGLAQGLQYLHEEHIVHMNVKPANVLLDSDMNPKITDFGIAILLKGPIVQVNKTDFRIARLFEGLTIQSNDIAGTVGYMSPEYILEGTLSTMYDVYSFGVTLLETISSMCKTNPVRHHASVPWAWNVRENQQMGQLFDSSLFEESQLTEIKRCFEIGLLCTQFERAKRPTMASVLEMLNGKKELTTPWQPEYTKERVIDAKRASQNVRSRM
ncbi:cysteine-rich receptor-like protein kinase 15 isoform X2 [Sorghum bicolor]|uniref:non-specific serine/threonine protein kinase n=1 Tax=Sorghum bicolor TaxID=4558 RepID=A0A1Z5RJU3_SORBI|nr:cysteine-rich receptor-like protein kinase 15 isoform X2 [Sorghum bicolor]OQU84040.1 hypothetical protein SORBI_3005G219600 [Sorghum bicolor]|eukprot:XP_021316817.1 cysteine-rich receptor-like protein kinase 15 isoform X2 [Sorghum bicolor]